MHRTARVAALVLITLWVIFSLGSHAGLTGVAAAAPLTQAEPPSDSPQNPPGSPGENSQNTNNDQSGGFNAEELADALGGSLADAFATALNGTLPVLLVRSIFSLIYETGRWIYSGVGDALQAMNIVTQTPKHLTFTGDNSGLEGVSQMFGNLRNVALISVGVVVIIAGFTIMVKSSIGSTFPELMELWPRLLIGLLWLVSTPIWFGWAVDFTNALCNVIAGTSPLPGWEEVGAMERNSAEAVAMLVYAIAALFLYLQSMIRIAVLNLCLVMTPLALLCWVLPPWQWVYTIWVRILTGAFITQVLQSVAIRLGASLLSALMLAGIQNTQFGEPLLTAAIGLATLLAAWSLPKQVLGNYGPSWNMPRSVLMAVAAGAAVSKGAGLAAPLVAGMAAGASTVAAGMTTGVGAAAATAATAATGATMVSSIVPLPAPPAAPQPAPRIPRLGQDNAGRA
ncbi:MAG TPA: conjugal transfer protein TrbL family protein [Chloroflexota bacterium]|nr:conjugal transfer protein TrbL family protein [Chloroflexota bacterium]